MRAYLIDAENINFDSFIKQKSFKKKDYFYIIGNSTLKFSLFTLRFLQNKKLKIYDFNECSKDYADKIILSLLGFLLAKKKIKKCFIVSNDKIFSRLDFTKELYKKRVKILSPSNDKIKKIQESAYHIELFEKNERLIKNLREESVDLGEFHRLLQKHFKIHGTLIYKYLKQEKNEEFFTLKKTKLLLEKPNSSKGLQSSSKNDEQVLELIPNIKLLSHDNKVSQEDRSFNEAQEENLKKEQEANTQNFTQKKQIHTQNKHKKSLKNIQALNSNEDKTLSLKTTHPQTQENNLKEKLFKQLFNPLKLFKK
ncbi:hypothetical protein [Campylobacter sp. MIT 97-5078]|uniref:hypothetical protein n=1 Tax=Campylobacter sp. MIT 97-5078 TaxID=1548153 RepID=UPI00068D1747|nr:hypothetical protein [Campylobacter sp. MIT 97-5078]TQR27240.1 hypothetical protein DMB91_04385 [Campylobacter sp. MIT 97-5078]